MQGQKTEKQCFYQNVQCVIVFIEQQEASGFLSSLGIKTPLSKIPLVGPLKQVNTRCKINQIVNKSL